MNIKLYLWNIISKLFKMPKTETQIRGEIAMVRSKCNDILRIFGHLKDEKIYDDVFIETYTKTINRFNEDVDVLLEKSKEHFTNQKAVKKFEDFKKK